VLLPRRPLATVLALLLTVGAAGACSKKKDDGDASSPRRTTTTAAAAAPAGPPTVAVTITGVDANGTRTPDDATVAAVKATLDRWIATAVVAPLHSGQPAGDLSALFTAAALERMAAEPAVRATLVDEGLPPATKGLSAERATAALFSVAGPDEVVAVIAAQVDIKLRSVGAGHDVDVSHYGELVLVQDGDTWKIDAVSLQSPKDSRA
jgi:hypothetical protein